MARLFASVVLLCIATPLFAQNSPAPGSNVGYPLPPREEIPFFAPPDLDCLKQFPDLEKELQKRFADPIYGAASPLFGDGNKRFGPKMSVPAASIKQEPLTGAERKKLEEAATLTHFSRSFAIGFSFPNFPS